MHGTITRPLYDWNGRKYLEIQCEDVVYRLKVPFRYGRVMCPCGGLLTVQEMPQDQAVEFTLKFVLGIAYNIRFFLLSER
jgi:hypothetical protein